MKCYIKQREKKNYILAWGVFALLCVVSVIAVATFYFDTPPPPATVTAERILPVYAAPGSTVRVQIRLTHRAQRRGVIVREYFPKGWNIVQAHPPASSLDNIHGVARWIIKAGDDRDRVVYMVQVDPAAKTAQAVIK